MTRSNSPGVLLLEDGRRFRGRSVSEGTAFGEVVFNTSMTGYQEILTDPSYCRQIVVLTQPHIGNYGTLPSHGESARPWASGLVIRHLTRQASGTGSDRDLAPWLSDHGVPALENLDTRALVRHLRDRGAMRGAITSETERLDELASRLAEWPTMEGQALVSDVTPDERTELAPSASSDLGLHVALWDFGAKDSIARCLTDRGARVTRLPAGTTAAEILGLGVDGVVLSNGPGDPAPLTGIVDEVRGVVDSGTPVFGICLGHQLLALAVGGRTYKLKFGHHGGNQPVREASSGKVAITSQNHGFAVDPESLPTGCSVSHVNLNDGTVEGLRLDGRPVFSVQYHPEAAPGPHDSRGLFDRFLASSAPVR